jgi:sec-independent protein translocase protein TatB
MPSFADSIFLFVLALLLFGPKKLPVLARELGKWMGEFRRASNEFKMQMEEELRLSEQADRQKQIAAMEAAAPVPPPLGEPAEPEHPHLRYNAVASEVEPPTTVAENTILPPSEPAHSAETTDSASSPAVETPATVSPQYTSPTADDTRPVPIATSGSLHMMPPATGLPTPRSRGGNGALTGLLDSIPETPAPETVPQESTTESLAHGD